MGNDELKLSIMKIRESLNTADSVDEETLALARDLERDISNIVSPQTLTTSDEVGSSIDLATALEAKFESEHPVAAGLVRELINALHKMGI